MGERYRIGPRTSTPSRQELADWLAKDGQLLMPLVELLEKGERAIDEVIDVMGRATVEAVLRMSAEQVAGPKEQGRRDADRELYWHGVQAGRVALKERQLRVSKPRLRKKRPRGGESGEVEVPAYTALQADGRLADRMLELMLNGVSTRKYETVLPALADQAGISKSEVSRETVEAGTRVLRELAERDLSDLDVLVVYLDGIQFAQYHVLAAVGVDASGRKHVLGLCGGASENTTVTTELLEGLVARGLRADRRRLFVIDGGGPAQRHRAGVRVVEPGAALPQPQAAERAGTSAEGAARAGPVDATGGLEVGRRRRHSEAGAVRVVARAGVAVGGGQPAGRPDGVVHGQPAGAAEGAPAVPDDDEHHRLVALGRAPADEPGHSLAERGDGGAVGGGDVPGDGEALSTPHRV